MSVNMNFKSIYVDFMQITLPIDKGIVGFTDTLHKVLWEFRK